MTQDTNKAAREAALQDIADLGQVIQPDGLDLESDEPLAPACDLSGEGSCEACT